MPAGSHPVFAAPAARTVRIWRYMDFTKYAWLLQNRALFFPRADLLDDPFEGSLATLNPTLWSTVYPETPVEHLRQVSIFRSIMTQWTFINSWHVNDFESAAMWKLYLTANEGIAVVSTYQRLIDVLPEEAHVGMVKYIDYEREWMPEGNLYYPFLHKRKSFEHERELRAVIMQIPAKSADGEFPHNSSRGRAVPIDLAGLIESVCVAPTAPDWFTELVTAVSQNVGVRVTSSDLSKSPFF